MNNKGKKEKGSVILYVLMVGILVFLLLFTSFTVGFVDFLSVLSNEDGLKAYYLAETGMEIILDEMMRLSDGIIRDFLEDLHQYKVDYLQTIGVQDGGVYSPPQLSTYLQQRLIGNLGGFNRIEQDIFSEYGGKHSFSSKVTFANARIEIMVTGTYNDSRKTLLARVELPQMVGDHNDVNGLIKIVPLAVLNIHQIYIE